MNPQNVAKVVLPNLVTHWTVCALKLQLCGRARVSCLSISTPQRRFNIGRRRVQSQKHSQLSEILLYIVPLMDMNKSIFTQLLSIVWAF